MAVIDSKKSGHKLLFVILFDLLIIVSLVIYFGFIRQPVGVNIHGVYMDKPIEITGLNFLDHNGKNFSKKNLQGHWSMVFFGYTSCPMICPTTMTQLDSMYKLLQQELQPKQLPQIIFISVDPDRDTIENLKLFIEKFNPRFIGLRADSLETARLEKELHVTVTGKDNINHSMDILLINPQGKVQAYFRFPHRAEELASDYRAIVNKIG